MNCNCKDLRSTWYSLMCKKRLYAKRACNRIPKEQISAEDMKRPDISESVNKYGYCDQNLDY